MRKKIKNWHNEFRSHILERGLGYYESGMVTDLEQTEDGYKAIVSGSEDYFVEIVIENGKVGAMFCDCPYADGAIIASIWQLFYLKLRAMELSRCRKKHHSKEWMKTKQNYNK